MGTTTLRAASLLLLVACGGVPDRVAAAANGLPRRTSAPREAYPGIDVAYDTLGDEPGHRLRLIVTHPQSATGPLPTVFVVGWLSCDSVEAPPGTRDSTSLVFQALAVLPGFVTVRLDKPGVGDSEGNCHETDFTTELAAYQAAFRSLARYPFVDPERIFLFGLSNGGGFAPLVPGDVPVRGYVIDGGWVKTWLEHMLEIERRRFVLAGRSPADVHRLMELEARLYEAVLLEGLAPAALFARQPELRAAWAGEDDAHLYGRPVAFYQQLQRLNLEEAWSRVKVPVLALHGQYDWIMSRDDHERIVELVNRNTPGAARFEELPAAGHTFEHYDSLAAAFTSHPLPFDPAIAKRISDWLLAHR